VKQAALLLLFLAPLCFALEDTLAKGRIRFKLTVLQQAADDYYDLDNRAVPFSLLRQPADYTLRRGAVSLDYGWTNDITFIFRSEYREREMDSQAAAISNNGVPGLYIGLRQRLSSPIGGSRLLAETGVFLPKEDERGKDLPLSSDGVDWLFIGSYTQNFYPTAGGFEFDLGYRFRNEAPDNEIFLNAKLALGRPSKVQATVSYDVVESQDDRQIDYSPLEYPNERGYQDLGLELTKSLTRAMTLGIGYEDRVRGRNQFNTDGWKVSLTWIL